MRRGGSTRGDGARARGRPVVREAAGSGPLRCAAGYKALAERGSRAGAQAWDRMRQGRIARRSWNNEVQCQTCTNVAQAREAVVKWTVYGVKQWRNNG